MQVMRQGYMGLFLTYLRFFVQTEHLLGGYVCVVVSGAVFWSCKGGRVACLEAMLLYNRSASLSLCLCRCAREVQHGGRVAPPLYVLHSAAS